MRRIVVRCSRSTDLQSVLDCVLEGGLELTRATLGNVQLMDWEASFLTIAATWIQARISGLLPARERRAFLSMRSGIEAAARN